MNSPIIFRWNGEAMEPLNKTWAKRADLEYVVGELYRMQECNERSLISHSHQFAWIKDAWFNLPEHLAMEYPSPESLRKRALIQAGFYDETIIDAGSGAAAIRVATAIRAIDDFALVFVRGVYVIRRTAKSQSRRAMDKNEFQASKNGIIEVISNLIGVTPEALLANAKGAPSTTTPQPREQVPA